MRWSTTTSGRTRWRAARVPVRWERLDLGAVAQAAAARHAGAADEEGAAD
jgi:hypothetical protein